MQLKDVFASPDGFTAPEVEFAVVRVYPPQERSGMNGSFTIQNIQVQDSSGKHYIQLTNVTSVDLNVGDKFRVASIKSDRGGLVGIRRSQYTTKNGEVREQVTINGMAEWTDLSPRPNTAAATNVTRSNIDSTFDDASVELHYISAARIARKAAEVLGCEDSYHSIYGTVTIDLKNRGIWIQGGAESDIDRSSERSVDATCPPVMYEGIPDITDEDIPF